MTPSRIRPPRIRSRAQRISLDRQSIQERERHNSRSEKAETMTGNVWYRFHGGEIVVTYSVFDLGDRYKLYRRVYVEQIGGGYAPKWKFIAAFPSIVKAVDYARRMYPGKVYWPIEADEDQDM